MVAISNCGTIKCGAPAKGAMGHRTSRLIEYEEAESLLGPEKAAFYKAAFERMHRPGARMSVDWFIRDVFERLPAEHVTRLAKKLFVGADVDSRDELTLDTFLCFVAIVVAGRPELVARFVFSCMDTNSSGRIWMDDMLDFVAAATNSPNSVLGGQTDRDAVDEVFRVVDPEGVDSPALNQQQWISWSVVANDDRSGAQPAGSTEQRQAGERRSTGPTVRPQHRLRESHPFYSWLAPVRQALEPDAAMQAIEARAGPAGGAAGLGSGQDGWGSSPSLALFSPQERAAARAWYGASARRAHSGLFDAAAAKEQLGKVYDEGFSTLFLRACDQDASGVCEQLTTISVLAATCHGSLEQRCAVLFLMAGGRARAHALAGAAAAPASREPCAAATAGDSAEVEAGEPAHAAAAGGSGLVASRTASSASHTGGRRGLRTAVDDVTDADTAPLAGVWALMDHAGLHSTRLDLGAANLAGHKPSPPSVEGASEEGDESEEDEEAPTRPTQPKGIGSLLKAAASTAAEPARRHQTPEARRAEEHWAATREELAVKSLEELRSLAGEDHLTVLPDSPPPFPRVPGSGEVVQPSGPASQASLTMGTVSFATFRRLVERQSQALELLEALKIRCRCQFDIMPGGSLLPTGQFGGPQRTNIDARAGRRQAAAAVQAMGAAEAERRQAEERDIVESITVAFDPQSPGRRGCEWALISKDWFDRWCKWSGFSLPLVSQPGAQVRARGANSPRGGAAGHGRGTSGEPPGPITLGPILQHETLNIVKVGIRLGVEYLPITPMAWRALRSWHGLEGQHDVLRKVARLPPRMSVETPQRRGGGWGRNKPARRLANPAGSAGPPRHELELYPLVLGIRNLDPVTNALLGAGSSRIVSRQLRLDKLKRQICRAKFVEPSKVRLWWRARVSGTSPIAFLHPKSELLRSDAPWVPIYPSDPGWKPPSRGSGSRPRQSKRQVGARGGISSLLSSAALLGAAGGGGRGGDKVVFPVIDDLGITHGGELLVEIASKELDNFPRAAEWTGPGLGDDGAAGAGNPASGGSGGRRADAGRLPKPQGSMAVAIGTSGYADTNGRVGLFNLGNTCYMNSAVQCLSHTAPLTEYFLNGSYRRDLNVDAKFGHGGLLTVAYVELLQSLWMREAVRRSHGTPLPTLPSQVPLRHSAGAFAARDMKRTLELVRADFQGHQQHDAQELLDALLGGLAEELNRNTSKPYTEMPDSDGRPDAELAEEWWRNHLARERAILISLFTGQFRSTLTCLQCGHTSARYEPFNVLQLPLPTPVVRYIPVTLQFDRPMSKPIVMSVRVPKNEQARAVLLAACAQYNIDRIRELGEGDAARRCDRALQLWAEGNSQWQSFMQGAIAGAPCAMPALRAILQQGTRQAPAGAAQEAEGQQQQQQQPQEKAAVGGSDGRVAPVDPVTIAADGCCRVDQLPGGVARIAGRAAAAAAIRCYDSDAEDDADEAAIEQQEAEEAAVVAGVKEQPAAAGAGSDGDSVVSDADVDEQEALGAPDLVRQASTSISHVLGGGGTPTPRSLGFADPGLFIVFRVTYSGGLQYTADRWVQPNTPLGRLRDREPLAVIELGVADAPSAAVDPRFNAMPVVDMSDMVGASDVALSGGFSTLVDGACGGRGALSGRMAERLTQAAPTDPVDRWIASAVALPGGVSGAEVPQSGAGNQSDSADPVAAAVRELAAARRQALLPVMMAAGHRTISDKLCGVSRETCRAIMPQHNWLPIPGTTVAIEPPVLGWEAQGSRQSAWLQTWRVAVAIREERNADGEATWCILGQPDADSTDDEGREAPARGEAKEEEEEGEEAAALRFATKEDALAYVREHLREWSPKRRTRPAEYGEVGPCAIGRQWRSGWRGPRTGFGIGLGGRPEAAPGLLLTDLPAPTVLDIRPEERLPWWRNQVPSLPAGEEADPSVHREGVSNPQVADFVEVNWSSASRGAIRDLYVPKNALPGRFPSHQTVILQARVLSTPRRHFFVKSRDWSCIGHQSVASLPPDSTTLYDLYLRAWRQTRRYTRNRRPPPPPAAMPTATQARAALRRWLDADSAVPVREGTTALDPARRLRQRAAGGADGDCDLREGPLPTLGMDHATLERGGPFDCSLTDGSLALTDSEIMDQWGFVLHKGARRDYEGHVVPWEEAIGGPCTLPPSPFITLGRARRFMMLPSAAQHAAECSRRRAASGLPTQAAEAETQEEQDAVDNALERAELAARGRAVCAALVHTRQFRSTGLHAFGLVEQVSDPIGPVEAAGLAGAACRPPPATRPWPWMWHPSQLEATQLSAMETHLLRRPDEAPPLGWFTATCGGVSVLNWELVYIDTCPLVTASQVDRREAEALQHHSSVREHVEEERKPLSLKQALDIFSREELLDDERFCRGCSRVTIQEQRRDPTTGRIVVVDSEDIQMRKHEKKFELWRLPPFLIVQLKRFHHVSYVPRKLTNFVDFPTSGLDLKSFLGRPNSAQPNADVSMWEFLGGKRAASEAAAGQAAAGGGGAAEGNVGAARASSMRLTAEGETVVDCPLLLSRQHTEYDLYGVVNHVGAMGAGHYTAYARPSSGAPTSPFVHFNDSRLAEVEAEGDVKTPEAYLLFYVRKDIQRASANRLFPPRTSVEPIDVEPILSQLHENGRWKCTMM